jgi:hypothetical protein
MAREFKAFVRAKKVKTPEQLLRVRTSNNLEKNGHSICS